MWLFFRPSLVFTSHISWHLYWHIFWNIFSHILYILTKSLRWTFAYRYIMFWHIFTGIIYIYIYIYIHICWSIACVCIYIYNVLIVFAFRHILWLMTYLLALLLTHVFRQFLWHIPPALHRPCGHHTCHMDEDGDMEPWGAMIRRRAETKSGDRHISSWLTFMTCRKKSPFWPWPGETIPWSSIRATTEDWNLGACGLPLAPLHLPSARLPLERMVTVECTTGGSATSFFNVPEHQMSHFAHTSSDHPQLSEGYPLVN